jgi:hypothetical protein
MQSSDFHPVAQVPLNPAGYKKTFCEAVKHHDLAMLSNFSTISRG